MALDPDLGGVAWLSVHGAGAEIEANGLPGGPNDAHVA